MLNAKLRVCDAIIDVTNLVRCRGGSPCPPASEDIIYGRARRLAPTLFDGWFWWDVNFFGSSRRRPLRIICSTNSNLCNALFPWLLYCKMIILSGRFNMRMWRNWQTCRPQTPVDITSLWVQVPSSAPKWKRCLQVPFLFYDWVRDLNPWGFCR